MKALSTSGKLKSALRSVLCFTFWIIVWHIVSKAVGKEILVPQPYGVLRRITELGAGAPFWVSTSFSLLRITGGFMLGVIFGTAAGILCHFISLAHSLLSPLLAVVRATPVASFIILVLIWLNDEKAPVFISFLIVLPIITENIFTALQSTDKSLREVCDIYRFTVSQRLKYLYIPQIMSYFRAGARVSLGMAWKAGVAAEVLCTPKHSIGTNLYDAKIYLETTDVFAWTAVVIIVSVVLEKLMLLVINKNKAGGLPG